jgi:signal transduction histidine kinase
MDPSRWVPTWLVLGLASVPVLAFFSHLDPNTRDLILSGYVTLIMTLGLGEAFLRSAREPALRKTWQVFGIVFLLAALTAGGQSLRNLAGGGLVSHIPLADLSGWGLVALLLLLVPLGFNRAQSRSHHPWVSFLDGAVFTVALNQVLWMWVLHPIAQRAGLPGIHRVGVLLLFGLVSAALGLSFHVLAKGESIRGPVGFCTAALGWLIVLLPWWVQINFLQEVRPAHPFRLAMQGGFLLLWVAVRAPWPVKAEPRKARPWIMNLLPYIPAGIAFLGTLAHDLFVFHEPDRLNTILLGSLAILVLLRQVVAFREIWRLKQNLEEKVEARTRELAESSRILLRTQRMNLIATLGAGIAHDLNNLIGAALLSLDLMEPEPQPPNASGHSAREALQTSLEKAGQLTRRLLSFGRNEERPESTVELGAHLQGMYPILRALVPASTRLDVDCGTEKLLIRGNTGLIDQVVVNLVVNARDATPAGGVISLTAEALPRASEQKPWVRLSVADSGTGIPTEILAKIFEPFFSTKGPGKGTGLGLGSVKAVVHSLGGEIEVQSTVGRGSRFSVQLPLVSPSAEGG